MCECCFGSVFLRMRRKIPLRKNVRSGGENENESESENENENENENKGCTKRNKTYIAGTW